MTERPSSNASVLSPTAALLREMVQIESVNASVSGNLQAEKNIGDFLEKTLIARGLKVRRLSVPDRCDNLLATYTVDAKLPWLMFESHLDTVTLEGMTIPPLAAEIKQGRLWGRGSCDTKGTGAAMIQALTQYMAGPSKPWNIAIAFVVDEEFSMTGVRSLIKHWDSLGFSPQGVVVGEPTKLQPIVSHNGAIRWEIHTHGVAAHSANPSLGRSAISDMMRIVDCLESRYIPSLHQTDSLTGKAQCSVNMIQGGVQFNIIPKHCLLRCDRRIVPGEEMSQILPTIDRLLQEVQKNHPGMKYDQKLILSHPPLTRKHNVALTGHIQTVLSKLGHATTPLGVPYCTDGGDLDQAGIPCIVLGPGDIAQAHTQDEWIDLQELEQGVAVYLGLMQQAWAA